jgi:hypothetical protein
VIRFVIALVVVVAVIVGGLMAFRRNNRLGQPSQDVIERVKVRERQLQAHERAEDED